MLGVAWGATQAEHATGQVYARACDLARQVGTTPELFPALWGLWYAHIARGEMPRARTLAEEFLELAQQQQDPLVRAAGHRVLANTARWRGQVAHAQGHCPEGAAVCTPRKAPAKSVTSGQASP